MKTSPIISLVLKAVRAFCIMRIIWSLVCRKFLNPHWYLLSRLFVFIHALVRFCIILSRSFERTLSRLIGLYLSSMSESLSGLGIMTIVASFQVEGKWLRLIEALAMSVNACLYLVGRLLMTELLILSGPGALWCLSCLIMSFTSFRLAPTGWSNGSSLLKRVDWLLSTCSLKSWSNSGSDGSVKMLSCLRAKCSATIMGSLVGDPSIRIVGYFAGLGFVDASIA